MNLYGVAILQGTILGVGAGNVWSAPLIGGASVVGLLIVLGAMCLAGRSALWVVPGVAALAATAAWPIAVLWQHALHSAPNGMLAVVQLVVLLGGSQLAVVIGRRIKRKDVGGDRGDAT